MNDAILITLSSVVPLLVDMALKGALLLALAGLATTALWRASAALRHMIWSLTMVGLVALPLLSALLPQWRVLPQWLVISGEEAVLTDTEPAPPIAPEAQPEPAIVNSMPAPISQEVASSTPIAPVATAPSPVAATTPPTPVPSTGREKIPVSLWLCASWLLGGAMILLYVLLGRLALWRATRTASAIGSGAWTTLLQSLAERLRLRRKVTLLRSDRPVMPMTWGIRRARILLPGQSEAWPAERRRAVLLHEMAHVRRWDCLTQFLTNLACAMHWFNPLVWIARRLIVAESECACDDLVLAAGFDPSDYAQHLLQIASGMRGPRLTSSAAIAMARPSKLEGRLLAVLDTKRSRRALTRWVILACLILTGAIAVPLAVMAAEGAADNQKPISGHIEFRIALRTNSSADAADDEQWRVLYHHAINLPQTGGAFATQSTVSGNTVDIKWESAALQRLPHSQRRSLVLKGFSYKPSPISSDARHATWTYDWSEPTKLELGSKWADILTPINFEEYPPSGPYMGPMLHLQWRYVAGIEFRLVDETPDDASITLPEARTGQPVYLMPDVVLSGEDMASAIAEQDGQGNWVVRFTLTPDGTKTFARITKENLGRRLAIVFDGTVISSPTIQSAIIGGTGIISFGGKNAREEALRIADSINNATGIEGVSQDECRVELISTADEIQQGKYRWKINPNTPMQIMGGWYTVEDGRMTEYAGGGRHTPHTQPMELGWSTAVDGDMLLVTREETLLDEGGKRQKKVTGRVPIPVNAEFRIARIPSPKALVSEARTLWRGDWVRDEKIVKSVIFAAHIAAAHDNDAEFRPPQEEPQDEPPQPVLAKPADALASSALPRISWENLRQGEQLTLADLDIRTTPISPQNLAQVLNSGTLQLEKRISLVNPSSTARTGIISAEDGDALWQKATFRSPVTRRHVLLPSGEGMTVIGEGAVQTLFLLEGGENGGAPDYGLVRIVTEMDKDKDPMKCALAFAWRKQLTVGESDNQTLITNPEFEFQVDIPANGALFAVFEKQPAPDKPADQLMAVLVRAKKVNAQIGPVATGRIVRSDGSKAPLKIATPLVRCEWLPQGANDPSLGLLPLQAEIREDGAIILPMISGAGTWKYWYKVAAEDYAPMIIGPYTPGQPIGDVTLLPPIEISGEIRGPATPSINYEWQAAECGDKFAHTQGTNGSFTFNDGKAGFRVPDLYAGGKFQMTVDFEGNGKGTIFSVDNLTKSIRGLIITTEGSHIEPASPTSVPELAQPVFDIMNQFTSAVEAGDVERAQLCYRPGPDAERQARRDIEEWAQMKGINPGWTFRTVSVYWNAEDALVVSNALRGDPKNPESHAVLALTLKRWTEGERSGWAIADIDLEPLEGLQREIGNFLDQHPKSQHWVADQVPSNEAE